VITLSLQTFAYGVSVPFFLTGCAVFCVLLWDTFDNQRRK